MADRITNDDIIKALIDVSFYKSVGETSLSNIADKLGIKKASLYNHFNSRESLIHEAINSCSDYISKINFIPSDVKGVVSKYSASVVIKGIAGRYIKMHQKSPLFQIYTFIQSQKYFNLDAEKAVSLQNEKFQEQIKTVLTELYFQDKISVAKERLDSISKWLTDGIERIMEVDLLEKKKKLIESPEHPLDFEFDEDSVLKINTLVDDFIGLLEN